MPALLDRLAPGYAAKLGLALDLLLVLATLRLVSPGLAFGAPIAALTWLALAAGLRHYDLRATADDPVGEVKSISLCSLATAAALGLGGLWARDAAVVAHAGLFGLGLALSSATLRLTLVRAEFDREGPMDDVLIVGTADRARELRDRLARSEKRRALGWLRLDDGVSDWPSLGGAARLKEVLRQQAVSEVYFAAGPHEHADEVALGVQVCEQQGLPFALPAVSVRLARARLAGSHLCPDGYLHFLAVKSEPHQVAFKRLFDLAGASLGLLVLAPLMLAVAVAVKLTSRGPLLFRQTRFGLQGRPFQMLKFRSMVVDAEARRAQLEALNERSGPVFKLRHDPRVTAVGRFIRRYSIDELPQLFNVLKGEMSLVGPRPPLPREVAQYRTWQLRRLSVRPGLTCIWQVSGRDQIGFDEWMTMDMRYIDHWSLRQDFGLIWKTVGVVLRGRGAS